MGGSDRLNVMFVGTLARLAGVAALMIINIVFVYL